MLKAVLIILALLFIVMTVLPRIRHSYWVIRAFDFPRLQVVTGGVFVTILYLITWDHLSLFENVVLGALGLALAYQMTWLWHYMPWATRQAKDPETDRPDDTFTVMWPTSGSKTVSRSASSTSSTTTIRTSS
jgi:hypothetical protein